MFILDYGRLYHGWESLRNQHEAGWKTGEELTLNLHAIMYN